MHKSYWLSSACYGLLVIAVVQYSGADYWLATHIFELNRAWSWQNSWLLEQILHQGGRGFVACYVVLILTANLVSLRTKRLDRIQRLSLLYMLLATALALLLIAALKTFSYLPCPWSVQGLGGDLPYAALHQFFDGPRSGRQCFPAGHASGGYALFSLYFALKLLHLKTAKPVSRLWLLPALLVGGLFGVAQQLRGAHFLSHDMTTGLLCWLSCYAVWTLFARRAYAQIGLKSLDKPGSAGRLNSRAAREANLLSWQEKSS